MKRIVTKRAYFTETVEIQWVRLDGSVYYERYTFPPKAVQEAREKREPIEHGDERL